MNPRNHYEALGVTRDAPPEVVRAAYLALVKVYHPDGSAPDAERIRQITAAWRALGRASNREAYDARLAATGDPAFSHGADGWGEDADAATTRFEEVDDPGFAGAPGWGEPVADAVPGDRFGGIAARDRAVRRPADPAGHVWLLSILVALLAGVTAFGAVRVDAGWALASGAAGLVTGGLAWRGWDGWAVPPLIGAWICAVAAVVDGAELLRWRGWEAVGSWLGGWVTALAWLVGIAFTTVLLYGAFDEVPATPDDWDDGA